MSMEGGTTWPQCLVKDLFWFQDQLLLPGLEWYFRFRNYTWMQCLRPLGWFVWERLPEMNLKGRARSREGGVTRTPRSPLVRPSPSLSSMERGRPSTRGRVPTTRNSSPEETRMDQMALLMESMMARMERLEGSSRSSRRSGTSHSHSFRDHTLPGVGRIGSNVLWDDLCIPDKSSTPGAALFQGHLGCTPEMPSGQQVPHLEHRFVTHAAQVFQPSQAWPRSEAQALQATQAPQVLPRSEAQALQLMQAPQALPRSEAHTLQATQAPQALPSLEAKVLQATQAPQTLPRLRHRLCRQRKSRRFCLGQRHRLCSY